MRNGKRVQIILKTVKETERRRDKDRQFKKEMLH
jgi:hypothetical protein